jgi:O-ureido-D-serine cyclo-ligase
MMAAPFAHHYTADPVTIALVSARAARDLDEDLPPLIAAFQALGSPVSVPDWDDPAVDWGAFELAILRSTWDYATRLPEFFAWLERAARLTRLVNPVPVIRWNTDKHYLDDLARAGVATVPSQFVEPGEGASAALAHFRDRHGHGELVVKPAIGAGSRDAQRYRGGDTDEIVAHVRRLIDTGRSALLQPYLARVDAQGETALIYFAGRFSHAIRKGALLRTGEGPTDQLFATETITPREPTSAELRLGEQTLRAIPFGTLVYARVDLIRDPDDAPCVLELELTEPSVFLLHAAGAAERFARAILACREG